MADGTPLAQAFVRIRAKDGGVGQDITQMVDRVDTTPHGRRLGVGLSKSIGGGLRASFGGTVKSALGGVLAGAAIFKGVDMFKDFVSQARESAKVANLTTNAIKSTGGAAGLTAKQVGDLATAVSNKTGIDDEAIQTNENVLLTFTKVRNEVGKGNDVFSQATSLAQDMATVLGTDAAGATLQLGKALNDPIKGITALSRAGVSFTQQQKDQIKGLVEHGKTLKAQKIILGEVTKEFGGAAAAAATPVQKLQVQVGNIKEAIGGALLPIIDRVASYLSDKLPGAIATTSSVFRTRILPVLRDVGGFIQTRVIPVIKTMATYISGTVVPILAGVFRSALSGARSALSTIGDAIQRNRPQLEQMLNAFKTLAQFILTKVVPLLGPVLKAAFHVLGIEIAIAITVVSKLYQAWRIMAKGVLDALGIIVDGAAKAFGWVPGIGGKLKSAAGAFDRFRDRVFAALDGAGSKGEQFGHDFAAGLARGIAAGGKVAIATAVGVANKIAAQYARAQQSSSPSRIAIKLGEYFSQGIAIGIRKGGKDAVDAVTTLVGLVRDKVSQLHDARSSLVGGVADSVRGVLDVSQIGAAVTTQDSDGNDVTTTPSAASTVSGFAGQAVAFAKALGAMAAKKLPASLIAAVAAAGPLSGLTAATALANESAADDTSVRTSISTIDQAARTSAQIVLHTTPLPAQIKREEATLASLKRIEHALTAKEVAEFTLKGSDLLVVLKRAEKDQGRRG